MFLRWIRYRDKDGRVRLYPRLLISRREGAKVRHKHAGLWLRIIVQEGIKMDEQTRRDMWSHLDDMLGNRPTAVARANIERVFAGQVGPRPAPTALELAWRSVLSLAPDDAEQGPTAP
jgi:hypothetical protein